MPHDPASNVVETPSHVPRELKSCSEPPATFPEMHDTCESCDITPSPIASKLPFSHRHLNLMARYIRKFLGGSLEWYHLVLSKPSHYVSWIVPMSGQDERNLYHYVMVCPKGSFKRKIWRKFDNVDEKCVTEIKKPIDLVHVLVYISNLTHTTSHPNYKLPPHSVWILASLWKEGLQALFDKETEKLPPQPFWFPVRKTFKPTENYSTEYFLFLKDGSPLYFEKDDTLRNLNNDEWTNLQLTLGNKLLF